MLLSFNKLKKKKKSGSMGKYVPYSAIRQASAA